MNKKYMIGAALIGALAIGWAWVNQPNSVVSNNNAPGVTDSPPAPAASPAPKANNSGTPDF